MSTTVNIFVEDEWSQVELTQLSNIGTKQVELWIGTEAPTNVNNGHILNPNDCLSSTEFEPGDLYWLRCKDGVGELCITRATNV